MGFRTMGTLVQLNDYEGEIIALRYQQEVEFTHAPAWNGGNEITQTVPRAELVKITRNKDKSLRADHQGNTLVFPQAIANDLRGSREWAYGVLATQDRDVPGVTGATMKVLEAPADLKEEALVKAFEAARISI